ncbi:MAG: Sec-independent protein translocase subunit TatA/TatB [Lacipirellulaceae bacterium]
MFGLGPTELLIVGVVAVLLFGSRLPSVARSAGKSLTEFKRGMQDLQEDVRKSIDADERAAKGAKAKADEPTPVATDSHGSYPTPEAPLHEQRA